MPDSMLRAENRKRKGPGPLMLLLSLGGELQHMDELRNHMC